MRMKGEFAYNAQDWGWWQRQKPRLNSTFFEMKRFFDFSTFKHGQVGGS
jgi:hypothetical protein